MLKPQDILVSLKLAVAMPPTTYEALAASLNLEPSTTHRAVQGALEAGLLRKTDLGLPTPHRANLLEFCGHGLRFLLPAKLHGMARGMPTAHGAPPLSSLIAPGAEPVPVWSHEFGTVRGVELEPIHRNVPAAALKDEQLYALLTLVDALRVGAARERNLAKAELEKRLVAS